MVCTECAEETCGLILLCFDLYVDVFKLPWYTFTMNDRNWGGKREGAGRKKGNVVYKTFSVVLPVAEADLLKEYARKEKLSVSRFISKALGLSSMVRIRKEMEEERKKSETKQ